MTDGWAQIRPLVRPRLSLARRKETVQSDELEWDLQTPDGQEEGPAVQIGLEWDPGEFLSCSQHNDGSYSGQSLALPQRTGLNWRKGMLSHMNAHSDRRWR
jgi:hypothetical protein